MEWRHHLQRNSAVHFHLDESNQPVDFERIQFDGASGLAGVCLWIEHEYGARLRTGRLYQFELRDVYLSVTTDVTVSTLTVSGLLPYSTYYLRAGASNWDGVVNFVSLSTSTLLGCGTINSVASSSWSLPSTWDIGAVPTSCNGVVITAGNTVTIDISSATASTTTVAGTLTYARSGGNELVLVQGSMTVVAGGILDMGNSTSPIPSGTTAYLTLALGTPAGQYSLVISTGGNFSVYGDAKNPGTVATGGDITPATNNITVADATGWNLGDSITIDTETVTITSVPSGNSFSITSPLTTHYSTNTIRVNVLTHNVVVRSSSTAVIPDTGSTTSSYMQNLAKSATSFSLTYGEFAYLGVNNIAGVDGIDFINASGSISSCTFRNSYLPVYLRNSSNNTLSYNTFYNNAGPGIVLVASLNNTILSNWFYDNGHQGIILNTGSNNNTLTSNVVYANYPTNGTQGSTSSARRTITPSLRIRRIPTVPGFRSRLLPTTR